MSFAFTKQFAIALIATAMTSPVIADTASQINSANELVREQKFDEAIVGYRAVTPTDTVRDDLSYNLAVAEFRKGEIETAKAMFTEAATSSDAKLAAAARYNLGNCFYTDAETAAEKDKPAAIEALRKAIEHYRASLAGNPNFVDARANIELAVELMKKLQQENQQQQKQQQKQDHEQKDQEQQQEQQNKAEQDQQKQDSESKSDKSQKDQLQEDQKNQEQQGQGSESEDKSSQEQSGDQDKSKSDEQQAAEGQRSEQEPSKEESSQSRESKDQPGKEAQPKPDQSSKEERVAVADPNAKEGLMSKEEALKMLQAVRDRDMLRRLRHEQVERSRHIQTDRDW